ncbi:CBS domain-containing protein [Actinocatenispora thailandica]|uniref:CBS domain-containing protein n=1 Tax=Actinocatenispora thailandica TaxID=227318 RepID=A0A7R7DM51_9ACTN|nr:CBS domain-containing protein [Actinocatenispora thailandica]BCJ34036.1 CBS domain-containing protein [Actinocatenispora thailandica]
MATTKVRDVMTAPVVTINEDATYKQAVELLLGNRIGAIPVLDEQRHLAGIASESDLLAKVALVPDTLEPRLFARHRQRQAMIKAASDRVTSLMSTPVLTVSSDASLVQAARLMHDGAVNHLPVVNETGALVGIVSRGDLLQDFLRSDAEIRGDVVREVVRGALASDPTEIYVEVDDGIVTLSGQVEHDAMIPLVTQLTRAVNGVVDVVNKLTARRVSA